MAEHAAGFGIGLGCLKLERRNIKFFGDGRGHGKGRRQPVSSGYHAHAAFQELAAAPPRTDANWGNHDIPHLRFFLRLSTFSSRPNMPRLQASKWRFKHNLSTLWAFVAAPHTTRAAG